LGGIGLEGRELGLLGRRAATRVLLDGLLRRTSSNGWFFGFLLAAGASRVRSLLLHGRLLGWGLLLRFGTTPHQQGQSQKGYPSMTSWM